MYFPTDASPTSSRAPAHDSGPMWIGRVGSRRGPGFEYDDGRVHSDHAIRSFTYVAPAHLRARPARIAHARLQVVHTRRNLRLSTFARRAMTSKSGLLPLADCSIFLRRSARRPGNGFCEASYLSLRPRQLTLVSAPCGAVMRGGDLWLPGRARQQA